MLPRLVMKFGGTSLGTADVMRRAALHVKAQRRPRLVVVSAVGGVTDLLLMMGARCCKDDAHQPVMDEVRARHDEVIAKLGLDPCLLDELNEELSRLMVGVSMLRELSPRIRDRLVSLGERMSVRLFAEVLQREGLPAAPFDAWDLGLLTTGEYGNARPLNDWADRIKAALSDLSDDCLPVVTGFIARSEEGEITTLGRGGSDLTAALFGAAAGVEEIQIWTDVPGFLRADPRMVDDPVLIPELRFEEAAELAYFGAKVLHPKTIEPARKLGIPVRVLGTFHLDPLSEASTDSMGTLIHDQAKEEPVRALALQQQVQSMHIQSSGMLDAPGFLNRVFEIFSRNGISVDVIATSEVSVSLTFDREGAALIRAVDEISAFAQVDLTPDRSILCLVGTGMREDPGILARIFAVLAEARVPVHVISQGASRINITLVIERDRAAAAMIALHRALFDA